MRSDVFVRVGLLLIVLALLLPAIDHAIDLAEADALGSWQGVSLRLAAACFAMALVLAVVEKIGLRVAGARCRTCRRRVPHGHAYCFDHLLLEQSAAREKLHGRRGIGV